jgi:hypothetical protein
MILVSRKVSALPRSRAFTGKPGGVLYISAIVCGSSTRAI